MKDKQVGVIYQTKNYSQFKIMKANRVVNEKHVRRLMESFKKNYLYTVITINHKHEIVDGQHRFTAAKRLGLPINYTNGIDYGVNDAQIINLNQVNWNKLDYMESFCTQGKEVYLQLKDFMSKFPDFKILVATKIFTGLLHDGGRYKSDKQSGMHESAKDFETGNLQSAGLAKAYANAKKIMDFKAFYEGFNRNTFVTAVLPLLNSDIYKHSRMIQKLKICPTRLQHCANVKQYRYLLQEIYNYKSRDDRADFVNI